MAGLPIFPVFPSPHDDGLFLRHAFSLIEGQWLGEFGRLTLAKGPLFPIFIAAVAKVRIPLLVGEALLWAVASAVFVAATGLRSWGATAVFGLLLFNPLAPAIQVGARLIREGIYPALSLLAVACAIGLVRACALRSSVPRIAIWSVGAGLSVGALWTTREEGPWILPPVVLAIAWAALRLRHSPGRLALLLLVPVGFACVWTSIAATNYSRYGTFRVTDFTATPVSRMLGALTRVRSSEPFRRFVVVPRSVRESIYAASPSFAELRVPLEGSYAGWQGPGCSELRICDDFAFGWLTWAIRDAMFARGYFGNARTSENFALRVAQEINFACDSHALSCEPPRTSTVPPLRSEYLKPALTATIIAARKVFFAQGLSESGPPLARDADETEHALALVRSPAPELPSALGRRQIFEIIRIPFVALNSLGALILLWGLLTRRLEADLGPPLLILCTAVASRILVIAFVHVTSFPATTPGYLSPAYALSFGGSLLLLARTSGSGRVSNSTDIEGRRTQERGGNNG